MEHTVKLYTQRVAPNPTKLDLYLAEKTALGRKSPLERIRVNLMTGEQRSHAIEAKNPLRRVPFLELDDGAILAESLAIIEYFEERWPEPSLIGSGPQERALTRALERSIDADILSGILTKDCSVENGGAPRGRRGEHASKRGRYGEQTLAPW
jgi:glutathione S-transferase